MVLSFGFWQRRFGGDSSVIGRIIHLNNKPATVVGVLPYEFASLGGQYSDVWLPVLKQPYFIEGSKTLTDATSGSVRVWGRLAAGVSSKAAAEELLALTNELRKVFPKTIWNKEYVLVDAGGHVNVMESEKYQVAAMVAAFVLLILTVACTNLGSLMVARGVSREREISIRLAIGASRARIFRQLFTESLLLGALGAITGVGLSWMALRITLIALDAPGWMNAAPDWRVLGAACGLAFVAVVFFGFAPALQIARQRYRKTLMRQILVGAQVAASCILLIVSGLLAHALDHVLYRDPGFGYEQVLGVDPGLGSHGYTPAAARIYLTALTNRLRALPGVEVVGFSKIPLLKHGVTQYMTVNMRGRTVNVYPNWVNGEFFSAMRIRVLRGRTFFPQEKNAVIVSDSFARKEWASVDPLGKPLWRDDTSNKDRILAIAANARVKSMNDGDAVEVYWPVQPDDLPGMTLLVKTAGAPDGLVKIIRSISAGLDGKLFPSVWLLKAGFHETARDLEKLATVIGLLAVVAFSIAGVGIAGLVGYAVSQQKKELAIRLALGAKQVKVLSAVLRQFQWPLICGLLTGLTAAAAISGTLRKTLYGISNLDAASYAAAVVVILLVGGAAALAPARQVLRFNVAKILRYE